MGKLVKNHLARLLTLTAAMFHLYTTILSFFWPKLTFDFLTTTFHPLVAPVPYLQIINLLLCATILALEYPVPFLIWAGTDSIAGESSRDGPAARSRKDKPAPKPALAQLHARIETRLLLTLPLAMLASVLVYQCASAGAGYAIAWAVWAWGFVEGEVVPQKPWAMAFGHRGGEGDGGVEMGVIGGARRGVGDGGGQRED